MKLREIKNKSWLLISLVSVALIFFALKNLNFGPHSFRDPASTSVPGRGPASVPDNLHVGPPGETLSGDSENAYPQISVAPAKGSAQPNEEERMDFLENKLDDLRDTLKAKDRDFVHTLHDRCENKKRGKGKMTLTPAEYQKVMSLMNSVSNKDDSDIGSYSVEGKKYNLSERSLLALTMTSTSEAMGLDGKGYSTMERNYVSQAELATVMKVMLSRMGTTPKGDPRNDGFFVASMNHGGAFNGWMRSSALLPCMFDSAINDDLNFRRALRGFIAVTDPRTKFINQCKGNCPKFSDLTQFFAGASSYGQFRHEFLELANPVVILPNGHEVNLYKDAGSPPLHFYDSRSAKK